MRIPANPASDSDGKHPLTPTQNIQSAEQRDAGVDIISEVDGFGQTRTCFSRISVPVSF
jgi:hypothetical protein